MHMIAGCYDCWVPGAMIAGCRYDLPIPFDMRGGSDEKIH